MLSRPTPLSDPVAERVGSVDALRGLVITLMIFVNDVAGAAHAPSWLRHVDGKFDGMTLPDIVFPCFLFIAGVSIPLAIERGREKGLSTAQLFARMLGRTFALLTMGVLMVNAEEHAPGFRGAWALLAYIAMLLAFVVVPEKPGPARTRWRLLRLAGWIGLVALALSYRTAPSAVDPVPRRLIAGPLFDATDTTWLRHSWWGILGLIGWAYLTAGTIYLFARRRREWLVGSAALLMLLYAATRASAGARWEARGWLAWANPVLNLVERGFDAVNAHVSVGTSLGSLAGIVMAGVCLGAVLLPRSNVATPSDRLRWARTFALGLLLAALVFDPLFGINKIQATPTWGLLAAAIATLGWMALYVTIDVRGGGSWAKIVRPAGANPLLAYLLHPLLFMLARLFGLPLSFYHNPNWPVAVNVAGSLLMALAVVQLTGLIGRTGYRLRA